MLLLLVYRTLGTITILGALLILVAHTDGFRQWFKGVVLDLVNDQLEGRLTADDVHIDIFRGIVIDRPVLYAHGTTVLAADRLAVSYDLAALFVRVASINRVFLERPDIRIIRTNDGEWNINHIVKPSADTTTSAPPDGTVVVRHFWVQGARLRVNDRTTEPGTGSGFDPMHLDLSDLNLSLSARVGLRSHDAVVAINGLSWDHVNGPLDLQKLHAVIRATPTGIDIQSMHIELPQTDLWVRARMEGVDVFEGFSDSLLREHPLIGRVETERFYGPDLHYVVPDVDLLDHYALKADVTFTGDRLDVTNMTLRAGDASIVGSCTVDHLSGKQPLSLDIQLTRSSARYADVRRRLRFVPLPELPFLTQTTIEHLHMKGEPEHRLWFEVRGSDQPGTFDGEMTLFLDKPTLGYEVDMQVRGGDLSVFNRDSSLATDLNGRVMMVGSGVTLQELFGTTQIELDRSMVFGRQVRTFRSIFQANGHGVIRIDTLFADLSPFLGDTLDEMSEIYAMSALEPRQTIAIKGELDVTDPDLPRYYADVRTEDLNLARLFSDPALPSVLTSGFVVNARGTTIDDFYGSVDGRVQMLILRDRGLMPFNLDLLSTSVGAKRSVRMRSDFGSILVEGKYQPSSLISAIGATASTVSNVVAARIKNLVPSSDSVSAVAASLEPFDAFIDIDLKEASPLNLFLLDLYVSGLARLQTTISSTSNVITIDLPAAYLDGLQITGDSLTFYADPTTASGRLVIKDLATDARVAQLEVDGVCDSVMVINSTVLRRPRITLAESDGVTRLSASSGVNEMAFAVAVSLRDVAQGSVLDVDSLSFSLDPEKGLAWRTTAPSSIGMYEGTFTFHDLQVARTNGERITLNGQFSDERFTNANVRLEEFPLRDIPLFAPLGEDDPIRLLNGMVTTANITVNGSWRDPVIDLDLQAESVSYNRALIGTLQTHVHHEKRTVTATASISDPRSPDAENTLDVVVRSLPLDLGFAAVATRLDPTAPIDMEAQARHLALAAIEPFLPAVESVRGTANGKIAVTGTADDISLAGTATFKNGRFLASSTNLVYQAEGAIHLDDNNLVIDSVQIRNLDRDLKGGSAVARGVVVFDGLAADSIDFSVVSTGKTGVKIMGKASQARSPEIYGDLVVRTGVRPIRLYGKLDAPKLSGDMVVRYSDIVFPEERSSTKAKRTSFLYVQQDERVYGQKSIMDYVREGSTASTTTPDTSAASPLNAEQFVVSALKAIAESNAEDFVDLLDFDLNIYLEGRTLLTMVFGMWEILTADLEQVDRTLPLHFSGRFGDNSTNLRGTVRLKEGASTYKFYKPFRTSGELNFSAGGLTNPTLNLKAVYEDRRVVNDKTEEYKVELAITGTKAKPKINYRVWRKGREVVGDSAKVAGDALMLILVGRTQDELFQEGQGDFVGQVNSAFSAVATGALSDLVGDIGIIQNAQLDVGSDVSQSRLTLSGQLFGDVTYRVSGQISDFSGNSTFTISMPLSVLADEEALRYLRADFSSTVNNSGNITRQTRLWEIKLGARLP